MNATTRLALGAAALLSTACAGIALQGGADFEPSYDFSQYTSYHWDEPDTQPTGDPRLDNNPFFVNRLHSAVHWELANRGIHYQAAGPAIAVHHHAVVRDRVEVYEADKDAGYTSEYGPGTQVLQYQEGTFLVDIADARTNEIIWRGWARLDLDKALNDPGLMAQEIDRAIGKMFESFPIKPGSPERAAAPPTEGR
jgi:Domain of unknown function (DUF4136)